MLKTKSKSNSGLALLLAGLFCLFGTQTLAQTVDESNPPEVELTGTPALLPI